MPRVKVPVPAEKVDKKEAPVASGPPVVETTLPPEPVQSFPDAVREQGPPRYSSQQLLLAGFGILVIILLLFVVNLTRDRNQLAGQVDKLSSDSSSSSSGEIKQLTDRIGQFYLLPTNETPVLANISDANAAKNKSAFFKNAQNGDKVLLYSKAGIAILYRPEIKKVVNVAPLDLSNASTPTDTSTNNGLTPPAQ